MREQKIPPQPGRSEPGQRKIGGAFRRSRFSACAARRGIYQRHHTGPRVAGTAKLQTGDGSERPQREPGLLHPTLCISRTRWPGSSVWKLRSVFGSGCDCFDSMRDDQQKFLAIAGQLPARLTAEQTAWVLGCQLHDMPILIATRLLKPLGSPAQNSIKFFATVEVLTLSRERNWLTRMTAAINAHWKRQNLRRGEVHTA